MQLRLARLTSFAIAAATICLPTSRQSAAQSLQEPGRRGLEFEVASIRLDNELRKPGAKPIEGGPGSSDPGRITYRQMPLFALILQAYQVSGDQLLGLTTSPGENRYTVTATFPPTTTKEQFHTMFQNLLADRFHLALHHETRDFPGFALVVDAGGPKFKRWTSDPNAPPAVPGKPLEDGQSGFHLSTQRNPPVIQVTSRQSMTEFAEQLRQLQFLSDNELPDTGRNERLQAELEEGGPVIQMARFVDQTGLSGEYEINLEFEGSMIPEFLFAKTRAPARGGPTLAQALEKQLGLKLVKLKSVRNDVLVVDHVDKVPTEN